MSVPDYSSVWEQLAQPGGKIVLLVLDGAGGLPFPGVNKSALEAARTPNLDALAASASCGMLEMVGPGITPGSGPGHLALFGYEPLSHQLGRGVLSALGVGFGLQEGDVAARINFATRDRAGRITDRRAGRIPNEVNERLCRSIREQVKLEFEGEYFLFTESQHRAVLILRGPGLGGNIGDTDPQKTGVPPLQAQPTAPDSEKSAAVVRQFVEKAHGALAGETPANTLLLRGFERYKAFPTLAQRFKLNGLCIAQYPMYRGVSRLLGMDVAEPPPLKVQGTMECLVDRIDDGHDFFFVHIKGTDSAGEDGDFDAKVATIEEVDKYLPLVSNLNAEVFAVAADHSTPAVMQGHSWHPVPALIRSRFARVDEVRRFSEDACVHGSLGLRPATHLMGLLLAHAGRLKKFGA